MTIPTDANYLIPTLNNMGYTPKNYDVVQEAFINFSASAKAPVLDIGAAFGVATLPALATGASVIANDLDIRHLEAIAQQTPEKYRQNLKTVVGCVHDDLKFVAKSLEAVLIARVLHFFSPEKVLSTLLKIKNWLQPNGKIFIVVTTPFIKILENYLPIYQQKLSENDPWPGYILDASPYLTEEVRMPFSVNLFDQNTLHRVMVRAGYHIEELFYFPAECPTEWLYDGREFLGCIASSSPQAA